MRRIAGGGATDISGYVDGTGTVARFNGPRAIVVDSIGILYVGDTFNYVVRRTTSSGKCTSSFGCVVSSSTCLLGVVTTIAGSGSNGYADGTGTNAAFNYVNSIACDTSGIFFVGTASSVRKITPSGSVQSTFLGCC